MDRERKYGNVLVIGNGFDLEHSLPTKYTDFIDFISNGDQSKAYSLATDAPDTWLNVIRGVLGEDNQLYAKITGRLKSTANKKNWVDFELEIAQFVRLYESFFYSQNSLEPIAFNAISAYGSSEQNCLFEESFSPQMLKEDFYRLRYAFELYIAGIVNSIPFTYKNKGIVDIKPDAVISFNYSDTYERLYDKDTKLIYIHGKAQLPKADLADIVKKDPEYYNANSHIVFGMDEYLKEEERKSKNEFFLFRKYFQRTKYNTDSVYSLDMVKGCRVLFFGYSLNSADANLIRDIIGNKESRITVFYHDDRAKEDEIRNLYSIFDLSIEKRIANYASNAITFVEQSRERIRL